MFLRRCLNLCALRHSVESGLSPMQLEIIKTAKGFAEKEIDPYASDWDETRHFPREVFKKAGDLGFGGIYVGDDYGTGLTRLDAALVFEQLSAACPSTASFISIHNMVMGMIDKFGTDVQKERYLPEFVGMEKVASYCLTEPGSGSDSAALKSTAEDKGDHWLLNGEKAFISGGGSSELYAVMVRTGQTGAKGITCMLIDHDAEGLSFGKNELKMGWSCQPTRQVIFQDCKVPKDNVLGGLGGGFKIAMKGLDGGRINIAVCSLGAAQRAYDLSRQYVKERQAFGKPLAALQDVQFKLADMATKILSSRLMVREAARKLDEGDPDATAYCAMAKLHVTEECYKVVDTAIQLHGGYGYLKEYKIERFSRDLRVHRILEGANEIMKLIISRTELKD